MSKETFLTVAEFAEKAGGISKQAIYQRMKSSLKPYVKNEDGVMYLSSRGLELFSKPGIDSDTRNTLFKMGERLDSINEQYEEIKGVYSEQKSLTDEIKISLVGCRNSLDDLNDKFKEFEIRQEAIESNLNAIKFLLDGESNPILNALKDHLNALSDQITAKDKQLEAMSVALHESHVVQLEQAQQKRIGFFKKMFS